MTEAYLAASQQDQAASLVWSSVFLEFRLAGSKTASSSHDALGAFPVKVSSMCTGHGNTACPQVKKTAQKGTKKIEKQGNKLAGLFGGK